MSNGKRTYGDSCGIARALDIVGERWALLVVRELVLGPKRFTDLRAGLPRVGPDMLAARLRELEEAGVVRRGTLPPPAASKVYELTQWGAELAPALVALGRWGSRAPMPDGAPALGIDAAVVALQTTFDAEAAGWVDATYQLALADQVFTLEVAAGRLEIARGRAPAGVTPAASLATDTATLAAVVWHGHPIERAIADGALRVEGDAEAAADFAALFTPPVPLGG
ncbi:MAG TPA: helix-turn-helix domain-containing protein [Solirubrobacteraceae bacterium]|jgi:DNA-binding HxlR family transcriptional regulator